MKIIRIFLIFTALFVGKIYAQDDPFQVIDALNNGTLVKNPCSDCQTKSRSEDCPAPVLALLQDSSSSTIYRLIQRKSPLRSCVQYEELSSVFSKELNERIRKKYNTAYGPFDRVANICASKLKRRGYKHYGERTKKNLAVAAIHHYMDRVNNQAIVSLQALQGVDSVFAKTNKISHINCKNSATKKIQSACEKLKRCPPTNKNLIKQNGIATLEALKAIRTIDVRIKAIKKRMSYQEFEDVEERKMIEALVAMKKEVKNSVPWVNGKKFKPKLKKLFKMIERNELNKGKERSEEQDNQLNEDRILSNIKLAYMEQMKENKRELTRSYDRMTEAAHCSRATGSCKRSEEIIQEETKVPKRSEAKFDRNDLTAYSMNKVACIEKELGKAQFYNEVALTVGEIGLGFLIGGYGGLAKTALTARRIFQAGVHTKAAVSAASIMALAAASVRNLSDLKKECKKASREIVGMNQINSNPTCSHNSNPQVITNYSMCITQFALLAATIVPATVSKGKKVLSKAKKVEKELQKSSGHFKFAGREKTLLLHRVNVKTGLLTRMTPAELDEALPLVKMVDDGLLDKDKFYLMLQYSDTLSKKGKKEFIKNIADSAYNPTTKKSKQAKIFLERQTKNEKKTAELEKKYLKQISKKTKNEADAKKAAKIKAAQRINKIQEVKYACRARKLNSTHKKTGALFSKISVGIGAASTVTGFTSANIHKPKDVQWWSKLGYELIMSYMLSKLGAKIMSNPSSGIARRYLEGNAGSAIVNGIDAGTYGMIFGIDENDAKDRLERIKNHPDKMKALEKLDRHMEENNLVDRFKETLIENYRGVIKSGELHAELGRTPFVAGDLEIDRPLTEADLDNPAMQDKVVTAIVKEMYNKERGYLNFGNKTTDRWMYDRGWNALIGVPKAMALALPFYYSLCMSNAFPVAGISAAVGLQTLNQFLTSTLYFEKRQTLINQ